MTAMERAALAAVLLYSSTTNLMLSKPTSLLEFGGVTAGWLVSVGLATYLGVRALIQAARKGDQ